MAVSMSRVPVFGGASPAPIRDFVEPRRGAGFEPVSELWKLVRDRLTDFGHEIRHRSAQDRERGDCHSNDEGEDDGVLHRSLTLFALQVLEPKAERPADED